MALVDKIEAILYLKGQPLTVAQVAEHAECDRKEAKAGLKELVERYTERPGALEVAEVDSGYCLQLRKDYQGLVETLVPVDLGVGALRTLAAIALNGPILQTELIELRGSGAYQHVQEVTSLGLVRKRRQSDGRSYWLQVTERFYQYFQVDKLPAPFDHPVKGSVKKV
ncbi:MAG: SMC-Scp complex subunit ScpB [Cyanobacteria bacterium P01_A01_bin.135]